MKCYRCEKELEPNDLLPVVYAQNGEDMKWFCTEFCLLMCHHGVGYEVL